ncbi:uncharacterized protein AB9X84_000726 [Acanthopagrus schlegelii]
METIPIIFTSRRRRSGAPVPRGPGEFQTQEGGSTGSARRSDEPAGEEVLAVGLRVERKPSASTGTEGDRVSCDSTDQRGKAFKCLLGGLLSDMFLSEDFFFFQTRGTLCTWPSGCMKWRRHAEKLLPL